MGELEEGMGLRLDFDKLGKVASTGQALLPVVVQDADSNEVLILAYANRVALEYSLEKRVAAFWSSSRNELWVKGVTSGDTLALVEVRVNCEQNSLLYRVRPQGQGSCHTKGPDGMARASCYYRRIVDGALEPVS
jgi:phosphoribosyl-AMP cyclohydrolase